MRRPKSLISSQLSSVKSSRFFLSIASLSFFPDRLFSSSFPYRSSMITLAISGNNPLHDRGCIPDYCASSKAKRLKQLRPGLTERSRAECEHRVRALMRAARASLFERLLNDLFAGRFDSGAVDGFASLSRPLRHGLVSEQTDNDYPKQIWSVQDDLVFEAQLENREQGTYHGYPLLNRVDSRRQSILSHLEKAHGQQT